MDHIVALCAPLFRTQPPQAIPPPPTGSSPAHWLLGAFPTLPLSQQSVAVDLPLRLVSVSCFCMPKCASSVLPLFLISLPVPCVLVILCSGSPHLQCSVPLSLPVLVCYPGYLAVPLLVWRVLSGRSHAGAAAISEGRHQLAGGIYWRGSGSNFLICGMANEDSQ